MSDDEIRTYFNCLIGKTSLENNRKKTEEREKNIKRILYTDEYFLWIEKFTMKKPNFTDEDRLSFPEITIEDRKNMDQLNLLYNGIDSYAKNNYIYPKECDYGAFYSIHFNHVGYQIGYMAGQGVIFWCERVNIENEHDFIDFEDIRTNKKQPNTDLINQKLETLVNLIVKLEEDNVPIEAIQEETEGTIQKILKRSRKEAK